MDDRIARGRHISTLLVAVLACVLAFPPPANAIIDCNQTSTGLIPLTDLGTDTYQGEMGGLYPGGSNEMPPDHLELGLELATQVVPRAADGTPDPSGRIGLISLGVSNTMAEFNAFIDRVELAETNPAVALVNGSQVGQALGQWASNQGAPWSRLGRSLGEAGVTAEQVQVAWIKLPGRSRGARTLDDARETEAFTRVLQRAKEEFPNLVIAYLSSRIYGGYIPDSDSEPNAYNHGFEMKWLIEEQINGSPELNPDPARGTVRSPWIAWGPYMWADGTTPRSDGLVWLCDDYARDGVHPGDGAQAKVATMLMAHFSSDPTAAEWFSLSSDGAATSTTTLPTTTTVQTSTSATTAAAVSTTVAPIPTTTVSEAQAPQGVSGSASHWPEALTGVAAGLALGSLVGFMVLRRSAVPGSND